MIRLALVAALFASTCQSVSPVAPPDPWPITDPPLASAGASSCESAIENTKRLGCPPEADDAGAWCESLTASQRACLSSAGSCLATRRCAEMIK
jgi:hypothetical protein